MGRAIAVTEPFDPDEAYGNWWWGITPSALRGMLEAAGFAVDELRGAVPHDRDRAARMRRAVLVPLFLLLVAAPADAAFPGANGPIAYVSFRAGPPTPYVVDADGARPRAVGRAGQVAPAWSPDGAALRCLA